MDPAIRHKPDATFAFKPTNSLASGKSPAFNTENTHSKDKRILTDLKDTMANERAQASEPAPFGTNRPKSPDSDTDIDALIRGFSSLKHSVQASAAPQMQNLMNRHGKGPSHPKMMSSLKQKANVFIQQKSRPEHHLTATPVGGPRAPAYKNRPPPPMPMFSSNMNPAARPGGTGSREEVFYTDPTKASADLKALLEGGMEEEDDEAEEEEETKEEKKEPEAKEPQAKGPQTDSISKPKPSSKEIPQPSETSSTTDTGKPAKKVVKRSKIPKSGKVDGLNVQLLPHQVQGVEWMRGRELGPVKKGTVPKGGLLADDMGLGKTLQTISLILLNQKPDKESEQWEKRLENTERTTLVVAPLALIKQWEQEIKDKVGKARGIKVLVHHGPQRTKNASDLLKYDVVITTYQILVSDQTASAGAEKGKETGCFGLRWWRIVLDEAHTIKNRTAKSTKACYEIRSEYRWCLSGTPMQNNLDELQSLVRFLRIRPYDDLRQWREHIDKPMKNGKGHVALSRLHALLSCFMKRRTKDVLKEEGALVPGGKAAMKAAKEDDEPAKPAFKTTERKVVTVSTELSAAERHFYDRLEQRTDVRVQNMMKEKLSYASAFTMLLRLRQVCNHPKLVEGKLEKDKDAMTTDSSQSQKAQDTDIDAMADLFSGMGIEAKKCGVCSLELTKEESDKGRDKCDDCLKDMAAFESSKGSKKDKKQSKAKIRQRNRNAIIDSDDEDDESDSDGDSLASISDLMAKQSIADNTPTKRRRRKDRTLDDSDDDSESDSEADVSKVLLHGSQVLASAKIREMNRILHEEAAEHKFIIFSQFTSMLDLVEPFLRKEGFKYTRYDGGMRNDAREESLRQLRENKSVRVLLCSLKCGSLGLNLTAATRVIIIEPFWNPFVEEQAIDRVHRLTQTVDVVVYKLTAANTVEARIIDLQEKKRALAEQALEPGAKKNALKLGLSELIDLFKPGSHTERFGAGGAETAGSLDGFIDPDVHGRVPATPHAFAKTPKKPESQMYGRRW